MNTEVFAKNRVIVICDENVTNPCFVTLLFRYSATFLTIVALKTRNIFVTNMKTSQKCHKNFRAIYTRSTIQQPQETLGSFRSS
jgi:hypothetical protein